jgi:hypothetical protein
LPELAPPQRLEQSGDLHKPKRSSPIFNLSIALCFVFKRRTGKLLDLIRELSARSGVEMSRVESERATQMLSVPERIVSRKKREKMRSDGTIVSPRFQQPLEWLGARLRRSGESSLLVVDAVTRPRALESHATTMENYISRSIKARVIRPKKKSVFHDETANWCGPRGSDKCDLSAISSGKIIISTAAQW